MNTAYIVPTELLAETTPTNPWHATGIPADLTQSLLMVDWDDANARLAFESLPGVRPLGDPWDLLPADAAPLLASLQDTLDTLTSKPGGVVAIPTTDAPAPTVASALRKISLPGGGMLR